MTAYGREVGSLSKQLNKDKSSKHKTVVTDTFIDKGKNLNDKTSLSSMEEIEIRTHDGFADINFITVKNPKLIFDDILKLLVKEDIKILKRKNYFISCQKNKIKFDLEIMELNDPRGFNYIRLKKVEGSMKEYKELIDKLSPSCLANN